MRSSIRTLMILALAAIGCADDAGGPIVLRSVRLRLDKESSALTNDDAVRISHYVNGPDMSKWFVGENGGFATKTNEQSVIVAPLLLPHGCALDAVEVVMSGGNAHTEMPEWLPTVELVRRDLVAFQTEYIGVETDDSDSLDLYQVTHTITVDIDDEKVDASRMRYHVVFKTEYGENARSYSWFHGVRHRCAPTP